MYYTGRRLANFSYWTVRTSY